MRSVRPASLAAFERPKTQTPYIVDFSCHAVIGSASLPSRLPSATLSKSVPPLARARELKPAALPSLLPFSARSEQTAENVQNAKSQNGRARCAARAASPNSADGRSARKQSDWRPRDARACPQRRARAQPARAKTTLHAVTESAALPSQLPSGACGGVLGVQERALLLHVKRRCQDPGHQRAANGNSRGSGRKQRCLPAVITGAWRKTVTRSVAVITAGHDRLRRQPVTGSVAVITAGEPETVTRAAADRLVRLRYSVTGSVTAKRTAVEDSVRLH